MLQNPAQDSPSLGSLPESSPQIQVSTHLLFSKSQVTHLPVFLPFRSRCLAWHLGPYRGPMGLQTVSTDSGFCFHPAVQ